MTEKFSIYYRLEEAHKSVEFPLHFEAHAALIKPEMGDVELTLLYDDLIQDNFEGRMDPEGLNRGDFLEWAQQVRDEKRKELSITTSLSSVLNEIGDRIHANKIAHGWKVTAPGDWRDQNEVPAVLMLITTEVSETMEAFRRNDKKNFAEELADVMIRTVGLSHGLGIDLGQAILDKMEHNQHRPHKHGGKRL